MPPDRSPPEGDDERALAPYPTTHRREQLVRELAAAAGGELVEYGRSVENRPLVAVRIPSHAGPAAPRVMCSANIHGPEWIASQVTLGLLQALAEGSAIAAPLRDRAELWVVPCLNPDGYARTQATHGRGTLAELRTNARGVDLNRNFPRPVGDAESRLPGAGSSRPGAATYRGPHPLSEPETLNLDRLLAELRLHGSANLHSFMGAMIPARVTARAHFSAYRGLCRAFRRAQSHSTYVRLSSRVFDVFTGELEDHQHHGHDGWATCVETFALSASLRQHLRAPSTFWRFNPRDPSPWVRNDVPAIVAWLLASLELPRPSELAPLHRPHRAISSGGRDP